MGQKIEFEDEFQFLGQIKETVGLRLEVSEVKALVH